MLKHFLQPTKVGAALAVMLITASILLAPVSTKAQQYNHLSFKKIDSLALEAKPQEALNLIGKIYTQAKAKQQTTLLVKASIYKMLFISYLKEDSFDTIIYNLRQDIAAVKQPEKSILQSILASCYFTYYQQNSYRIAQRTTVAGYKSDDIKTWSINQLINNATTLYLQSVSAKQVLQKIKAAQVDEILQGDSTTRIYRPTLYDILAHRAIGVFKNTLYNITTFSQDKIDWLKLMINTNDFIAYQLPKDTTIFDIQALRLFQDLAKFHQSNGNNAALADVELKRLQFVYQKNGNNALHYNKALTELADAAKQTPIYSEILYEQATLHRINNLKTDTANQYLVSAVKLAKQAIKAFPNSIGAYQAKKLIDEVLTPELSFTVKDLTIPNQSIAINITHKNTDTAHLFIYKVAAQNQTLEVYNERQKRLELFTKQKPFAAETIILPKYTDYLTHTYTYKTNGLPKGSYYFVVVNKQNIDSAKINLYARIDVSNMVADYRQRDGRNLEYRVVNATTGQAIENAKIEEYRYVNTYSTPLRVSTNKNGIALTTPHENTNRALITLNQDTLVLNVNSYFYNPVTQKRKTVLFTDRPIYRPGQTVYYKGILLKVEETLNSIIADENISVKFKDVNNKLIEEKQSATNEYGSFQGSFTIPMGKLNGQMNIVTAHGSIAVQVEEYKRPTFEISYDKTDKKYKLNDTISVTGKATTFAGYPVDNATVSNKVNIKRFSTNSNFSNKLESVEVLETVETKTKTDGSFEIKFFAAGNGNNDKYVFQIITAITNNAGETQSLEKNIAAAKKDIVINAEIPSSFILSAKKDTLTYQINNVNQQPLNNAIVKTTWNLLRPTNRLTNEFPESEKYSLSREEFIKSFPFDDYKDERNIDKWPIEKTVLSKTLNTNNGIGNILINNKDLTPGYYKVETYAVNTENDTVTHSQVIRIYHSSPSKILHANEWIIPIKTAINKAENASFWLAGLTDSSKVYYQILYKDKVEDLTSLNVSTHHTLLQIKPKANFKDAFAIQFYMVCNGKTYSSIQTVNLIDPKSSLAIKFLSFRDKLQPGEKETWKLLVNNKAGEKEMAEMVATLYDASLDKFGTINWLNTFRYNYNYANYNWQNSIQNFAHSNSIYRDNYYRNYKTITRQYENLNLFGYNYYGDYNRGYETYITLLTKTKRIDLKLAEFAKQKDLVYGKLITNSLHLPFAKITNITNNKIFLCYEDGVYGIEANVGDNLTIDVQGYALTNVIVGKNKRLDIRLKRIKEDQKLSEFEYNYQPKFKETTVGSSVKISGKDLQPVPVASITDMLHGKVAGLNIQENTGSAGMRGSIKLRGLSSNDNELREVTIAGYDNSAALKSIDETSLAYSLSKNINPRTNFSETAFFYPELRTNDKGEINIEFTVPQSLTRYKMMGFAHTKDSKTAVIQNQLITQKQLAISVNSPRFFREGDTIWLAATVNNLAGKNLKGQAALQLFDAITGKAIQINSTPLNHQLEVNNAASQIIKWQLVIPAGINTITYKVFAEAGNYTDGEEMTIPVLPNSLLVTKSLPLNVRGNSTKNFTFDKLANQKSSTLRTRSLTIEYTSNPVWYAVQALPYLMEYPYECAEQTFSKFYANSFATGIFNSSPNIKTVFEQWQKTNNGATLLSNLEKNAELKNILLEETPWVREAKDETDRKKRIATLFDINRMTYELKNLFSKLQQMQSDNGAFPWFKGMPNDRYITQHIVMGMGQLQKANLIDAQAFPDYKTLTNKAIIYLDNQLIADYDKEIKKLETDRLPLHYLLARSYYHQKNTSSDFNTAFNYYLKKAASSWMTLDTYQQAQTALILARNNQKAEALKIINLLKQTAQHSDEMGMYWKNNLAGWWWYQNPVETQALLIEAFDEVANDQTAVEEMKIWLLKNKQTNDWRTTKATTAATYALLMKGYNLLQDNNPAKIIIGGTNLNTFKQPNAQTEAGTGYEKTTIAGSEVTPNFGKIEITNSNKGISWGAMYWQYFEKLDKITPANTGIKIKKQLFIQTSTAKGDVLTPITASNALKQGDLVKVRIEIYADRAMEYLHLKDMRSAGFEPTNVISRYKYQDGLGYYESTKDAATNFFINYMPKGTYVFEYPLRVTHSGNFSNGITSLQSMYAPEFTSYSEGIRTNVKP